MSVPINVVLRAGGKAFDPNNGTVGTGILTGEQFTSSGSLAYSVDGVYGHTYTITTSTSIGTVASGFNTINPITVRNRNPSLTCSFSLEDADVANNQIFIGFCPSGSTFLSTFNNDDPLIGFNGIGITLHEGNIKVAVNDGTGSTTFFDFYEPILAFPNTPYTLTITGSEENDGWYARFGTFSDLIDTYVGIYPVPIQTLLVGTEVPQEIDQLGACALINNKVAVAKSMKIYDWQGMF